jgi:hypothetical protein
VERILAFVEGGGVLICADPEAFSFDLDGTDLSELREELCGVRVQGPTEQTAFQMAPDFAALAPEGIPERFPLYRRCLSDGTRVSTARLIEVTSPAAMVLGVYPDGSPAGVLNPCGRGQVIYFAANPFQPEALLGQGEWELAFRQLLPFLGVPTDEAIWRFRLPSVSEPQP